MVPFYHEPVGNVDLPGTGLGSNKTRQEGACGSCGYPHFIRYGTIVESVNGLFKKHLIISKVG